jgi:hypothetical protein
MGFDRSAPGNFSCYEEAARRDGRCGGAMC